MNLYKTYEMDPRAEQEGRWFVIKRSGFEVKLARSWNARFEEMMASERLAMGKPEDQITDAEAEKILLKVFAHTVVLDWKNAQDRDGSPLPCTPDNVQRILTDLPELKADIFLLSRDYQNFRKEMDDVAAKN